LIRKIIRCPGDFKGLLGVETLWYPGSKAAEVSILILTDK